MVPPFTACLQAPRDSALGFWVGNYLCTKEKLASESTDPYAVERVGDPPPTTPPESGGMYNQNSESTTRPTKAQPGQRQAFGLAGLWLAASKAQALPLGSAFGLWIDALGLQNCFCEVRNSNFGLSNDALDLQDSISELRHRACGLRNRAFGLRNRALGLRDRAFGLRDRAFGFRDRAFGC